MHAAGVVIGDRDLSEYIPLCRDSKGNEVVTQYAMNPLNDLGLLKMDFLGLKTLTVIEDTLALIHQRAPEFSLKDIPLDDAASFALYNRGETIGLFQMESGGMTSVSKQLDVQKLDDIMALIALYRPGPMDLIGDYIQRKKGLKKISYEHPLLEEICSDTYGVMIYQEQVMAAANLLAGYSLGQSDLLRRAMGKKDKDKMAKERASFVEGCAETNKIPEKKANAIFDLLEKFAGYGFNKSHSAAYGMISYQTAYLKAHYPVEFMAGLFSNEINNTDKISVFVGECKRMGIPILPPDMNRSGLKFTPELSETWEGPVRPDGATDERGAKAAPTLNAIRYGLAAIKNVGEGAMDAAIAERERGGDFTSLEDFCSRLDSRIANRKIIESLVKAGAFDFLGRERAELFACIEETLAASAASHRDRAAGQVSLFEDLPQPVITREEQWLHAVERTGKDVLRKRASRLLRHGPSARFFRPAFRKRKIPDDRVVRRAGRSRQLHDCGSDCADGPEVHQERRQALRRRHSRRPDRHARGRALERNLCSGGGQARARHRHRNPRHPRQRDDTVRATAQRVKMLTPESAATPEPSNGAETNGAPRVREDATVTLRFAAGIDADELRTVREILASSPGSQPVTLMMTREDGQTVRIEAGEFCRVEFTPAIERQLAPWLTP